MTRQKERVVRATFSDGTVLERGSITKTYTHAWLCRAWRINTKEDARRWSGHKEGEVYTAEWSGFSSAAHLADKSMRSDTAWVRREPRWTITLQEVVPVEVIEKRRAA
jgi:hypothetical protein